MLIKMWLSLFLFVIRNVHALGDQSVLLQPTGLLEYTAFLFVNDNMPIMDV